MTYLKNKNILLILSLLLALMIIMPLTVLADDYAHIKKELDSSDWQVRQKAVEKLANRSDEEAIQLLLSVAGTKTEYWPHVPVSLRQSARRESSARPFPPRPSAPASSAPPRRRAEARDVKHDPP